MRADRGFSSGEPLGFKIAPSTNIAPLSVDEFLARPFEYQLWRNLTAGEVVRLLMLLNAGQQKVTPRHLLEIMLYPLQRLFAEWNVPLITEESAR